VELNREQGEMLVRVARLTLKERLSGGLTAAERGTLAAARRDPALRAPGAAFVTLTRGGCLRGCIGCLAPSGPLVEAVADNAVNAALHDPRFAPLTAAELDRVRIEVSVLTAPQPLAYAGPEDLLHRLRPGIDGVIIRRERASATFLPQVWKELPRPEEFLGCLCLKAGLPREAWKTSRLEVSTYQASCFAETPPPSG
jgi:AmmeMemoRadiSam system protein A